MDRLRRALAACAMLALFGCGPVTYFTRVTRKASADVEAARAAGAERHAPFWFTLAVEYLTKAREEAAEADFQTANRLGEKASEAAQLALDEVQQARRRGAGAVREAPAGGSP